MILSICDSPEVLSVLNIVVIVVKIIRIAVPILLILFLMLQFAKAVMNNDNEALDKAKRGAIAKMIAAVLIFLMPTFVNLIVNTVGSGDYRECINFNDTTNVKDIYVQNAMQLIEQYRESEDENDYKKAKVYINGIRYADVREELLTALEALHNEIVAKNNPGGGGIIDGSCYAEYENGYGLATISANITKAPGTNYKFYNAGAVVQNGSQITYKSTNLYEILVHPSMEVKLNDGKTKKVECEIKHTGNMDYYKDGYYFSKKATKDKRSSINNPYPDNKNSYFVYVPKNFNNSEKYPLVLALHGGFGWGTECNGSTTSEANQTYHYLKTALYKNTVPINKVDNADVNAIVIAPSNMTCNWEPSIFGALDILHAYIKLFNVDIDRVVVTGTSQGGYGTMYSGFIEEQIVYQPTNSDTTLESVAKLYNTTVDNIVKYNSSLKTSISYSNSAKTKLSSGTHVIIKPKSEENMRGLFSVLVPMSPAKNATRCIFVPSTVYDRHNNCKNPPPYTIKTPIWVITSNDEYDNIQQFAKL